MISQTLSAFGQQHPRATQWLIALLITTIGLATFLLGLFVVGRGWYEAQWPLWLSIGGLTALMGVRLYWKEHAPSRQAWFAFHLAAMLLFGSLNVHLGSRFPVKYGGEFLPHSGQVFGTANEPVSSTSELIPSSSSRGWLKNFIRKARRSVQAMPVWAKILLTVVTVALVLVLGYGIGALACALACSEMGIAAALVLIAGWGGLLVGGFFVIRRIWRGKRQAQATP